MKGQLLWKNSIGGVFMIRSIRTGKAYIGMTQDIVLHKRNALHQLQHGTFPNKGVQNDFDHGMRFYYTVLYCEPLERLTYRMEDKRRIMAIMNKCIDQYDSINTGYNLPVGVRRKKP